MVPNYRWYEPRRQQCRPAWRGFKAEGVVTHWDDAGRVELTVTFKDGAMVGPQEAALKGARFQDGVIPKPTLQSRGAVRLRRQYQRVKADPPMYKLSETDGVPDRDPDCASR